MALEIIEQVPDVDAIVVPTGGGGLLAGICVAAKSMNPDIQIIVELFIFLFIFLSILQYKNRFNRIFSAPSRKDALVFTIHT